MHGDNLICFWSPSSKYIRGGIFGGDSPDSNLPQTYIDYKSINENFQFLTNWIEGKKEKRETLTIKKLVKEFCFSCFLHHRNLGKIIEFLQQTKVF